MSIYDEPVVRLTDAVERLTATLETLPASLRAELDVLVKAHVSPEVIGQLMDERFKTVTPRPGGLTR